MRKQYSLQQDSGSKVPFGGLPICGLWGKQCICLTKLLFSFQVAALVVLGISIWILVDQPSFLKVLNLTDDVIGGLDVRNQILELQIYSIVYHIYSIYITNVYIIYEACIKVQVSSQGSSQSSKSKSKFGQFVKMSLSLRYVQCRYNMS